MVMYNKINMIKLDAMELYLEEFVQFVLKITIFMLQHFQRSQTSAMRHILTS